VTKGDRGANTERHGRVIRATAAACLALASGLLVWLSTMENAPSRPAARAILDPPPLATGFAPQQSEADPLAKSAREQIPTAQILAVAERFVATGDVLAARAMLHDRAGAGEPRALFALAETYDPHMLASWGSQDADPSATYARFLYEAARRGGIAEAQTRLEALK
jgi:hypothetical protein